jgi:large conductance mechanosensitive channel
MTKFLREFREFAVKGNLIETAVALVLALAFTDLVKAFIADIITPIIAAIFGKPDFSNLTFTINDSTFKYGDFINFAISFVLVAFVLFVILKAVNRMRREKEEDEGPTEIELLAQIRDGIRDMSPTR